MRDRQSHAKLRAALIMILALAACTAGASDQSAVIARAVCEHRASCGEILDVNACTAQTSSQYNATCSSDDAMRCSSAIDALACSSSVSSLSECTPCQL